MKPDAIDQILKNAGAPLTPEQYAILEKEATKTRRMIKDDVHEAVLKSMKESGFTESVLKQAIQDVLDARINIGIKNANLDLMIKSILMKHMPGEKELVTAVKNATIQAAQKMVTEKVESQLRVLFNGAPAYNDGGSF